MVKKLFTEEQEVQIDKEYFSEEKPSVITLGKKHGCPHQTIRQAILRKGHRLRSFRDSHKGQKAWNKGLTKETNESVKRMSEFHNKFTKEEELQFCNKYFSLEKPSVATLGKEGNCDGTTISNIIERNGYKLRTKSEARKGKIPWNKNKKMSEKTKGKLREKTLLQLQNNPGPYKDTKPELKMEEILVFLNIPYEKQFRVDNHL